MLIISYLDALDFNADLDLDFDLAVFNVYLDLVDSKRLYFCGDDDPVDITDSEYNWLTELSKESKRGAEDDDKDNSTVDGDDGD